MNVPTFIFLVNKQTVGKKQQYSLYISYYLENDSF